MVSYQEYSTHQGWGFSKKLVSFLRFRGNPLSSWEVITKHWKKGVIQILGRKWVSVFRETKFVGTAERNDDLILSFFKGIAPTKTIARTITKDTGCQTKEVFIRLLWTVNLHEIYTQTRSKTQTCRGNQKCLRNWKKLCHASLFFLHIVLVFRYWNATNNNALDGFIGQG